MDLLKIQKECTMTKYMMLLYQQYCNSIGKKFNIENIQNDLIDFNIWIEKNKRNLSLYHDYLIYNGITFDNYDVYEANKGKYDSIDEVKLGIVSPFASTISSKEPNLSIVEENGEVYIKEEDNLYDENEPKIYTPQIEMADTLITQNPYSLKYLEGFKTLHEQGNNICIGIYGNVNDRDKVIKEDLIKNLSSEMDKVRVSYETYNGKYMCIIKSEPKELKRTLSR